MIMLLKIFFKKILKHTPIYWFWGKYWQIKDYYTRPIVSGPSSNVLKHNTVLKYATENNIKVLVETGTFLGEMIEATKYYFEEIYSIEIDRRLFKIAKKKFKKEKRIKIKKGDSTFLLPKILKKINKPSLFWLDAHYSGGVTKKGSKDTPIFQELSCILDNFIDGSVILIDDARLFINCAPDYPSIRELNFLISQKQPKLNLEIKEDIIRIY